MDSLDKNKPPRLCPFTVDFYLVHFMSKKNQISKKKKQRKNRKIQGLSDNSHIK